MFPRSPLPKTHCGSLVTRAEVQESRRVWRCLLWIYGELFIREYVSDTAPTVEELARDFAAYRLAWSEFKPGANAKL